MRAAQPSTTLPWRHTIAPTGLLATLRMYKSFTDVTKLPTIWVMVFGL